MQTEVPHTDRLRRSQSSLLEHFDSAQGILPGRLILKTKSLAFSELVLKVPLPGTHNFRKSFNRSFIVLEVDFKFLNTVRNILFGLIKNSLKLILLLRLAVKNIFPFYEELAEGHRIWNVLGMSVKIN